jgi:hypothetical protein
MTKITAVYNQYTIEIPQELQEPFAILSAMLQYNSVYRVQEIRRNAATFNYTKVCAHAITAGIARQYQNSELLKLAFTDWMDFPMVQKIKTIRDTAFLVKPHNFAKIF